MKLSIIIPCYNEDKTIKKVLKSILKINFPIEKEIIIIDDGSDIPQNKFIKTKINNRIVKFIRLSLNQGKGTAIRIGLKYASGDIFIIQDADFEYNPNDILKLLKPVLKKKAKVVYGTRFKSNQIDMSRSHYFGNKFLTKMTNFLYKSNLTDMETGYKLFTKDILNKINLNTKEFEFEPEITSKIILKGYNIIEIPISYRYRKFSSTKITFFDGIESLLVLIQNRFFKSSKIFQYLFNLYKIHLKKILIFIFSKNKIRYFKK